jgi:hypothetical protein
MMLTRLNQGARIALCGMDLLNLLLGIHSSAFQGRFLSIVRIQFLPFVLPTSMSFT